MWAKKAEQKGRGGVMGRSKGRGRVSRRGRAGVRAVAGAGAFDKSSEWNTHVNI